MLQILNSLKKGATDVKLIDPTKKEIEILDSIKGDYKNHSQMSEQDRQFINSIVSRYKPKKLLEVGVSKGGSSIVILNAIKNIKNAHLYSCDYNEMCYVDKSKKTGFAVNEYPDLAKNWTLYTGGFVCNHLDKIGKDIDFCLLDTVHSNPGEILDFLMVLPYLKDDAIIILHDTGLHATINNKEYTKKQITTCLLTSAILGEKMIPSSNTFKSGMLFTNISAIKLNRETKKHLYEIFNLLTIPWVYSLSQEDIDNFLQSIAKNYDEFYFNYVKKVIYLQQENYKNILFHMNVNKQTQKTYFWGASLFLEDFLDNNKIDNPNIIGIIDRNSDKWGKKLDKYTIYSPEILEADDDCNIILSIKNNNQAIYESLSKDLSEKYPNIKILNFF